MHYYCFLDYTFVHLFFPVCWEFGPCNIGIRDLSLLCMWNWLQIFMYILTLLLAGVPGRRRLAAWLTLTRLALLDPQQDLVTLPTAGWKLLPCTSSQAQGRWMSSSLLNSDGNSKLSLTSTYGSLTYSVNELHNLLCWFFIHESLFWWCILLIFMMPCTKHKCLWCMA